MGYEELIRDLRREAEHKKEGVLKTAREEARRIIAEAMQQCDRLEQEFQDAIGRDLEQGRVRLLNRARREARMNLSEVKSELVLLVFARLEEMLKAVAAGNRYPSVLERLLNETKPEWPEGEVVVRADPKTQSLLKPLIGDRTARFEPFEGTASGEDPYGGFELSDRAAMVTIRNTFRSRLDKARPDLRVEMNRLLFGEIPAG